MSERTEMTNAEALQMMARCRAEITDLRSEISRLKPKAEAYENIAMILALLPRSSVGMGEDILWVLDQRIRELQPKPAETR